jgi:diguanylate cyclase (GGDEF)-like protein/PAS domain S-box-containing protein
MEAEMPLQILTIDDDPALHCLLDRSLQRLGFQVKNVTDGASGLAAIASDQFDLVIVDYDMPDMTGIDVVNRAVGTLKAPPIIMLTGHGNERVAVDAFNHGAADYLVKDVDLVFLDLLPAVIERVLARRRLEQERDALFKEVRESEERYRQLVDLIPDGVAVVVKRLISLMNPAGCRIMGYSDQRELVQRDFAEFFDEDGVDEINTVLASPNRGHWREINCRRKTGEQVSVELLTQRFACQGPDAVEVIFRDITEKKQYQEQLEHLATFDSLTDLANRALFFEKFQQLLGMSLRYKYVGALLFIDLDGFSAMNDTHGHDVGDQVLQEVAGRLRGCLRQIDVVARLGSDEFMVVLAKLSNRNDVQVVADKILNRVCGQIVRPSCQVSITCSIGISLFPEHGLNTSTLLRAADGAMNSARHAGGGCYRFAGSATVSETV